MTIVASSAERVTRHTSDRVNDEIRLQTELNVMQAAAAGPERIEQRLDQLDREWDIERVIQAQASSLMLLGLMLGATVSRKWFALPGFISGFLLQHAVQGWCPPVPLLRRLGFRTEREIECERYALKALRGDFKQVSGSENCTSDNVHEVIQAIER